MMLEFAMMDFSMLAALVHAPLLWGGLAAVSVPIVIHLLARRRFRRVRWAAMAFLVDAEKRNRRRVRIEELILLALRCLAIFLIGCLLARPFFKPTGIAAALGGSERTERVFLIDDSFSMGYVSDGVTALARAKESVANLVNRLREHAPGDTMTVLRTSELDAPLVASALLDDVQTEQLLARLEALEPSQQALSVSACLDAVERLVAGDSGLMSAALYVVSDFQRVDWGGAHSADGRDSSGSLTDGLAAWVDKGHALRVVLVDVGDDEARNVAVTGLAPQARQIVTGVEAGIAVDIGNYSSQPIGKLELDVAVGDRQDATVPVQDVPAGGRTQAVAPVVFHRAGDEVVRADLAPDDLPVDNSRSLAVQVVDAVRVLVINGEPSTDAYLDEVSLLTTALRPEGDVFSGVQAEVIDEAQLDAARFEDFHLVVACNLYRVSEPVADALHKYVAGGGGLLIFLGDQVSDPVLYNATLYRDGEGLLPASLQAVASAPEPGVTLAASDSRNPVVQVFAGEENPFRQRIHFTRYYEMEPAAEGPRDDLPGAIPRPAAEVLARFADANQAPAIVERRYGEGRVMLFASSCDLEWNDWARDASFVVAVQEMVQYLARASAAEDTVHVGEPIRIALDPSRFEPDAVVRGPGYPQEDEQDITATGSDTGMQLRWDQTDRAGVYALVMRERGGRAVTRRVAVTLDPRESDLAPAVEEELHRAFGPLPVEYVAGVPTRADAADEGRREFWPVMLVMALVTLMVEQFLAWRFGRV